MLCEAVSCTVVTHGVDPVWGADLLDVLNDEPKLMLGPVVEVLHVFTLAHGALGYHVTIITATSQPIQRIRVRVIASPCRGDRCYSGASWRQQGPCRADGPATDTRRPS